MEYVIVNCMGFIVPIALIILCCFEGVQKVKIRKATSEETKNYYWFKNRNGNEVIEEKLYSNELIIVEIFSWILIFFFLLVILYIFDVYNFEPLKDFISSEAFWSILGLNIEILAIISLLTVLKKDYYLGITVKDVMKLYVIPDCVMKVLIYSGIIFCLYGIYNVRMIRENEINIIIVELMIYSFIIFILFNLVKLIYKTVSICLNNSEKEMKAFKCLRNKILFEYQLGKSEIINGNAVERIATYLVKEIVKHYKSFGEKANKLEKVKYSLSIIHMKEDTYISKKYNRKFRREGTWCISIICIGTQIMFLLWQFTQGGEYKIIIAEILLTFFSIGLGKGMNVWNNLVVNRYFWIFNYENTEHEKIAAYSVVPNYNRRYEFIGAIEDLMCFYKILLYNKQGQLMKDIVIEKIKQKINKADNEKIRNTILLLLHYFEYEKCYIESEQKVKRNIKGKDKVEIIRKKTIKRIKKNNIYNYEEMEKWLKNIDQESAEYQLADSILKHVYKEPEINEDGTLNPEKLRNYKFEYYFEFIKNKVGNT